MEQPAGGAPKPFKPYVAPEAMLPEFTVRAVLLGPVLGVIFGAASVYLGLKIGLTPTASIPIAVLAIGFSRGIGRTSILENHLIQTVGSYSCPISGITIAALPSFAALGVVLFREAGGER